MSKVRHPVFPRRLRSQYWRGLTALLFLIRNELRSFRRRMAELAAAGPVQYVKEIRIVSTVYIILNRWPIHRTDTPRAGVGGLTGQDSPLSTRLMCA